MPPSTDPIARYYNDYWQASGHHPPPNREPELEAEVLHIPAGGWVLDLGCGDGQTGSHLAAQCHARYVGLDISAVALAEARDHGHSVVRADPVHLPFPDNAFDGALAVEVLEHLFLPAEAARELLRVLAPGAVLLATTPNTAYWHRRLELLVRGRFHPMGDSQSRARPWRDPHIRFFTAKSMRDMFTETGFETVAVSGYLGRPLPRMWYGAELDRLKWTMPAYRLAERRWPSLLSRRLLVVVRKPRRSS